MTTRSRLAVAVFSPPGGVTRPDPVVFLAGGPGGAFGFNAGKGWWWSWIDAVALSHGREFIAMDQRGVGRSRPRVDCPGVRVLEKRLLQREIPPEEEDRQWLAAAEACHQRLVREGFDLSIFGSAQSAADIDDLRRALGFSEWNLYGISYGTRLALTVARDHPAGVRSLVLDSVYPVDAETLVEGPGALDFAFRMMWLPCETDPGCAAEYPDMYQALERVIARLNERAVRVPFVHPDTLERYEVVLDGDRLVDTLVVGLSGHVDLPQLAAAIQGLDRGDPRAAVPLVRDHWIALQDEDFSYPVNFSVECREEVPFNPPESAIRAAALYPMIARRERRDGDLMRRVCDFWGQTPVEPEARQPVRTSIPALVLAGVFDPVTPATWAERLMEHLSAGHLMKFVAGHSVTDADPCALELIAAFLDDPGRRPEASCHPRPGGGPFRQP
jgi:pimeloyl-ACP methyl ester carboxylesterase